MIYLLEALVKIHSYKDIGIVFKLSKTHWTVLNTHNFLLVSIQKCRLKYFPSQHIFSKTYWICNFFCFIRQILLSKSHPSRFLSQLYRVFDLYMLFLSLYMIKGASHQNKAHLQNCWPTLTKCNQLIIILIITDQHHVKLGLIMKRIICYCTIILWKWIYINPLNNFLTNDKYYKINTFVNLWTSETKTGWKIDVHW